MGTESETKFPTLSEAIGEALKGVPETDLEAAPETAAAETVETVADETVTQDVETKVEPAKVVTLPQDWSEDWRGRVSKLPPEAQEVVLQQYKEMQSGFTPKLEEAAAIRKAFEPHRERLKLRGMSEAQAVETLLAAQSFLERDPVGALKYLAQQSGIDFAKLIPSTDETGEVDQTKVLKGEINTLRASQQQAEVNRLLSEFSQARDDKGQVKHPHFDKLRRPMAAFMMTGDDMETSYQKAVWSDSDLRQADIEAERTKTLEAERQKAEKERAEKVSAAKKAASHVPGKSNGTTQTQGGKLSDVVDAAMRQHGL